MNSLRTVYALATASRFLTISIAVISYLWTGSYDSSGEINRSQGDLSLLQRCLTVFLRWDALYFVHIAEEGYVYEQEHAFFPLLPLAARFLAETVLYPLQSLMGKTSTIILAGAIVSNVSFVLAAGALYKLSLSLFSRRRQLAFLSAFMFCLSPPFMFMSSIYTESLFAALSFYGMLWFVRDHYLPASLIWGIASAVRSNAIVYAGFFIYNILTGRTRGLTNLLKTLIYSCITMSGFAIFQYHGYQTFCKSMERPWCNNTIPLLYSFVQKEYWGNGLFAYYEVKQIPNFLLASPIICLTIAGIYKYAKYDWYRFLSLGKVKSNQSNKPDGYTSDRIAAFIYLWAFLLLYAVTSMHVQVIIRFFTSLPPLYWYTAQLLVEGYGGKSNSHRVLANVVLSYYILYGLVGIVLFAAFLPPA